MREKGRLPTRIAVVVTSARVVGQQKPEKHKNMRQPCDGVSGEADVGGEIGGLRSCWFV